MSGTWQPAPFPPSPQNGGNPFADAPPVNPNAAPQIAGGYAPPQFQTNHPPFAGLWRQGSLLVMHKMAPLPDICLKSNQPATRRLKRSLSWHNPWIFLTIFVHILVYVVIALIVRKTATIYIPLTDEWFAIRRRRMFTAWSLVLISVVLFFAAIPLFDAVDWAPLLMIVGSFGGLGAAIYGLVACRLVTPKRMTDTYIWLKGVHPEFLNRLEVWPYNI